MKKQSKTKKLLVSVMSTATLLAACSSPVEEAKETPYGSESGAWDVSYSQPEEEKEVELEHLQSRYESIDLDAMEDYFEEEGIEYDEEELIAALDEYEETGTVSENSHYSSFPWYLFLLSNGHSSKTGVVSSPKTNVTPTPKTTTEQHSTTTTQQPKTNTNQNSINPTNKSSTTVSSGSTSSYKSGFGSSSTNTGS